jgi:hypothetical protein
MHKPLIVVLLPSLLIVCVTLMDGMRAWRSHVEGSDVFTTLHPFDT